MPAVTAAMSSLLYHLAVDQLERLRDGDFAPKGMIEQDDQADHGASEGGDQSSKQQMSTVILVCGKPKSRISDASAFARSAATAIIRCHVCLWHKADMLNALTNVRFWGQSGH
jgi:hypothetical protein